MLNTFLRLCVYIYFKRIFTINGGVNQMKNKIIESRHILRKKLINVCEKHRETDELFFFCILYSL